MVMTLAAHLFSPFSGKACVLTEGWSLIPQRSSLDTLSEHIPDPLHCLLEFSTQPLLERGQILAGVCLLLAEPLLKFCDLSRHVFPALVESSIPFVLRRSEMQFRRLELGVELVYRARIAVHRHVQQLDDPGLGLGQSAVQLFFYLPAALVNLPARIRE